MCSKVAVTMEDSASPLLPQCDLILLYLSVLALSWIFYPLASIGIFELLSILSE